MAGFAKAILISILVAVVILMFSNMIFFFPWYMSVVYETSNLSQAVATDNYLKDGLKQDTLERLRNKPIFNKKPDDIKITAVKVDDNGNAVGDAVGNDDETSYFDDSITDKPYRQRGEKVKVTLEAVYPFTINVLGKDIEVPFHVSFSMSTTGLRYYKDLDDDTDGTDGAGNIDGIYADVP